MMKNVCVFLMTLAVGTPAVAESIEDEILIEAEAAMADSEAAIQEAQEAEKIAKREQKIAADKSRKAEREIEKARRSEAQAKRRIAKAERDRSKASTQIEQTKTMMEEAKTKIEITKDEIEEAKALVEESNAARSVAIEKKDAVVEMMVDIQHDLKEMRKKLASVKKDELKALKELRRSEMKLKQLQDKAAISYKNADGDSSQFLSAVQDHREKLNKISRRLDELEIEVETDKNFYDKQRRSKLSRKIGSTLSYSNTKVAKVMATGCNIRNFPSVSSKIVGKSRRGRKMKVKKHNRNWYSVVHKGSKAFMGSGCFRN